MQDEERGLREPSALAKCDDLVMARLTDLSIGGVKISEYKYNGVGTVVGIDHAQASIFNHRYAGSGSYPDLDRFNRVTSDTWYKDLSTDLAFYDTDITYDRNSNPTRTIDNIFTPSISAGFDAQYTMDKLNRLTKDEEGQWNGSAITNRSRQQIWTLRQTGNWDKNRVDRNGNNVFNDAGDLDVLGTNNEPNEITARDLDTDADGQYDDTHYALTYNKRGDLTDDAENYKHVYDGFGRLRQVKKTSNSNLVEEYWYNGLGHRIAFKYDSDSDNDVDSNDTKYHLAYDERWRVVATYRDTDTTPKEEFFYEAAGADGYGSSSYTDNVAMRDKDTSTGWTSQANGFDRRDYYCQNWRGDVVCLITSDGKMVEWIKYSAYGIPYGIPNGDTNGNGTVNSGDSTNVNNWWGTGVTKPTADFNLDGNINTSDLLNVTSTQWGVTLGWGKLSQGGISGAVANRIGYEGEWFEPILVDSRWCARHRYLSSALGTWLTRDKAMIRDSSNAYACKAGNPIARRDPAGLVSVTVYTRDEEIFSGCTMPKADAYFLYGVDTPQPDEGFIVAEFKLLEEVQKNWNCQPSTAAPQPLLAGYAYWYMGSNSYYSTSDNYSTTRIQSGSSIYGYGKGATIVEVRLRYIPGSVFQGSSNIWNNSWGGEWLLPKPDPVRGTTTTKPPYWSDIVPPSEPHQQPTVSETYSNLRLKYDCCPGACGPPLHGHTKGSWAFADTTPYIGLVRIPGGPTVRHGPNPPHSHGGIVDNG